MQYNILNATMQAYWFFLSWTILRQIIIILCKIVLWNNHLWQCLHAYNMGIESPKEFQTYCEKECLDCQDLKHWDTRAETLKVFVPSPQFTRCGWSLLFWDKNDLISYETLGHPEGCYEERLMCIDAKARIFNVSFNLATSLLVTWSGASCVHVQCFGLKLDINSADLSLWAT